MASSRSARTALPSEQNHPGRRLAQAAQPTGTCRAACFCFTCGSVRIPASAIVVCPIHWLSALPSSICAKLYQAVKSASEVPPPRKRPHPLSNSAATVMAKDVMGLTLYAGEGVESSPSTRVHFVLARLSHSARAMTATRLTQEFLTDGDCHPCCRECAFLDSTRARIMIFCAEGGHSRVSSATVPPWQVLCKCPEQRHLRRALGCLVLS